MNREQAELLYKGYQHVLGVEYMDSIGTDYTNPYASVCFVCEMRRAGLADNDMSVGAYEGNKNGFDVTFGVTLEDAQRVVIGRYKTGPGCAAIVKDLIIKYGHGDLFEERNFAAELMQQIESGPVLVEKEVA